MGEKLRVGIIGTGFGVKVHVPSMAYHDKFEVVAIAGRNYEKTKKIAAQLDIPKPYEKWEQLIEDKEIDIVSVTTPPYLHYPMAKHALEHNKHLLLEKPTTETALEAKKLIRIAESKELIGMICHEFRFLPMIGMTRDLINGNKIGEVREIYLQNFFGFFNNPLQFRNKWLLDSIYEGGILGAIGSHMIDRIRFISGMDIVAAFGSLTRKSKAERFTADDGFNAVLQLENGSQATVSISATISPSPPSTMIIGGTEGTLMISNRDVFFASKTDQVYDKLEIPTKYSMDMTLADQDQRIPPFLKLLDVFSRSIETGQNEEPSLLDGWKNQVVIEGIKLSQKLNSMVSLDLALM